MSIFGIWPILEIHRGMWFGYIFSCFYEHFFAFGFKSFLAFCPFSKCTKVCDPVVQFSHFMSVFGILAIFKMHKGMWSSDIFFLFHAQPQKSYQSEVQKRCPTKIKKSQEKVFLSSN